MRVDRRTLIAGAMAAVVAGRATWAAAATAAAADYAIRPEPIADGIWMVRGADAPIEAANGGAIANIAIIATPEGAVLCDCGPSRRYAVALKAVAEVLVGKPVVRVYVTHPHPDHALGLAAFDPAMVAALPETVAEIRRDGPAYSDAMYRILGDWMRGTDLVVPGIAVEAGVVDHGGRRIRLLALAGHSPADLALLDEKTGLLIAGDLVFHHRAPTTPTADLGRWRESLDALAALPHGAVLPGHGPLDPGGTAAIAQTRDWLTWLEQALAGAMDDGLDMVEAGRIAIPDRFAGMAAARYELQRSVSHLYPALEAARLPRIDR